MTRPADDDPVTLGEWFDPVSLVPTGKVEPIDAAFGVVALDIAADIRNATARRPLNTGAVAVELARRGWRRSPADPDDDPSPFAGGSARADDALTEVDRVTALLVQRTTERDALLHALATATGQPLGALRVQYGLDTKESTP